MSLENKIMLIDENSMTLKFIEKALKSKYAIFSEIDAKIALSKLQTPYGLIIISNTSYSKISPAEIVIQIKKNNKMSSIPIIYISPNIDIIIDSDFFYAGGNLILRNITDISKFHAKLDYLLNKSL